jgi:DNA processing protein
MIERDELAAWLRLLETPSVGRESARRLLAAFGSPEGVFAASSSAWREIAGPGVAKSLATPPEGVAAVIDTTWAWLADSDRRRGIVTLGDPLYPSLLLETADPPLLLYTQGRVELLQAGGIAIVGSRNPTPQGRDNARAFAATLSQGGLCVVSGLALGIDGAAHEGALSGPGSTIAVVGTGLDLVYPKRHRDLAHRVAAQGLMLSEYSLGTPSLANNFPQRNRIIAGLTRGTLVVEAAVQSGSLITARLASEAGRDVFAIPGSIHSPQSRGCHWLIKQGAKLVDSAQDILEELAGASPPVAAANDAGPTDPLLQALGYEPVSLDALVARTGCSAAELSSRMLQLELEGQVARLPGQLFQRVGFS